MKSVSMKQRLAGKKSLKKKWMQKESVSKQGRKSAKSTPTAHTDQVFDDVDVNDAMDYMETDAYMQKGVSTEDQVSTVKPDEGTDKPKVSTDKPEVSTAKPKEVEVSTDKLDEGTAEPKDGTSDESTAPTTVFRDDETIAEFLVSMSQNKAKQKGVEIKDAEDSDRPRATSTRSVLTLKPLPKIDPKDKGKKVLEEEAESDAESEGVDEAERKFDQLAKDEEIARKVQEDWEAEEEMKKLAEEEATKAALIQDFDDIQARIEADRLLAARLQEEERETFTVEERAKFLYDTIAAQRRFLAQQRAAAIRSRPPTRTQLRNQMMTYLKHVGGKKHADLKNKNFEEIQVLYKEVKRSDKNFIAIGSAEDERQIKEMNEESKDPKKKRLKKRVVNETPREEDTAKVPAEQEVTEQGTKKRKSGHVKMIARKRPRPQPDDDSDDEHRKCLRIVTFDSTIDSEIMETKSFVSKLHKVSSPDGDYLVVYRVNGHFRAFNYLMEVLHIFDRQDLFHLYDLVMKQYSEITPEGIELILWGDLKIMMESSTEENDQELKDGTVIYMLVERRYPLSKELLQRMLDLGLEVEEESTAALHLNWTNPRAKVLVAEESKFIQKTRSRFDRNASDTSPKFKKSKLKKHEVKRVKQSCLGEDCWELCIPDLVPEMIFSQVLVAQIFTPSLFKTHHAGCLYSCNSTSGRIQFLCGDKLVSWSSKKHDCTSMSLAKAEYVSLSGCFAQVLWLRTQITDYGFYFDNIPMYCDSKAAIAI
ncbi:hypothetical protein Tco_0511893 [Tanacetum coccineum]